MRHFFIFQLICSNREGTVCNTVRGVGVEIWILPLKKVSGYRPWPKRIQSILLIVKCNIVCRHMKRSSLSILIFHFERLNCCLHSLLQDYLSQLLDITSCFLHWLFVERVKRILCDKFNLVKCREVLLSVLYFFTQYVMMIGTWKEQQPSWNIFPGTV